MATATKTKMNMLHDCVLVEKTEAESVTPGGIVLPDAAKEKPLRGKVLAIGPGKLLESGQRAPIGVKPGDEVLYTRYVGHEVDVDGDECLVLRESDLVAVIEK